MHARSPRDLRRLLYLVIAGTVPVAAQAFGTAGHRIAGLIAEDQLSGEQLSEDQLSEDQLSEEQLCPAARAEVRALGAGADLGELGLWADRVRSQPGWEHTGPWHYVNIDDGASVEDYRSAPERDVLWAIETFSRVLAEPRAARAERAEALRFLTHFIVDLHQPLHVGREQDRGGNRVEVRLHGSVINLHRFWDTEVIELAGQGPAEYAARLIPVARERRAEWALGTPRGWAAESQALRPDVYSFGEPGTELSSRYTADARRITEQRLAQAGVRLAMTLNHLFC